VADPIEFVSLGIAIVALFVGIFPVRSYLVERYWPYQVTFREGEHTGLKTTQYRLYVTARNRTSGTTYFGLGWEGLELSPSPNIPQVSITRLVNSESYHIGSFPVGPNEQETWIMFFEFDRPITSAVAVSIFNRPPDAPLPGTRKGRHRKFLYTLLPTVGKTG
jgi:hypothetical protein